MLVKGGFCLCEEETDSAVRMSGTDGAPAWESPLSYPARSVRAMARRSPPVCRRLWRVAAPREQVLDVMPARAAHGVFVPESRGWPVCSCGWSWVWPVAALARKWSR